MCVFWRYNGSTFIYSLPVASSPLFRAISLPFLVVPGSLSSILARAEESLIAFSVVSCLERNSTFLNDRKALSFSFCLWITHGDISQADFVAVFLLLRFVFLAPWLKHTRTLRFPLDLPDTGFIYELRIEWRPYVCGHKNSSLKTWWLTMVFCDNWGR